ncbi:hypothetical protein ALC56_12487 [Trachymyrmex septentrionalis]|uniref:Uncharacterized protein n=1 Tax=Trachymyrmex septentrionalis TaxID=34720 RepID=A0A195EZ48_9HYME|nr:hypothetical protein ALC56_12487 [Trachymyrmex septentrionalis]
MAYYEGTVVLRHCTLYMDGSRASTPVHKIFNLELQRDILYGRHAEDRVRIPLSQRDVEDVLVALVACNEQWPISTTGWNKLVMNDAVDASPCSVSFVSFVFLFFP